MDILGVTFEALALVVWLVILWMSHMCFDDAQQTMVRRSASSVLGPSGGSTHSASYGQLVGHPCQEKLSLLPVADKIDAMYTLHNLQVSPVVPSYEWTAPYVAVAMLW